MFLSDGRRSLPTAAGHTVPQSVRAIVRLGFSVNVAKWRRRNDRRISLRRGFHNSELAGSADREPKPVVCEVIGPGCLTIKNRLAHLDELIAT